MTEQKYPRGELKVFLDEDYKQGALDDGYRAVEAAIGEDGVKTLVEAHNKAQKRIRELKTQLSAANQAIADLRDLAYNRAPKIAAEQADKQAEELRAQLAEANARAEKAE